MANTWMTHVKQVGGDNPELMKKGGFKAILKLAGKTWKKGTGAVSSVVKGTTNGISKVARTAGKTLKMKKRKATRKKGKKTRKKGKKTRGKR